MDAPSFGITSRRRQSRWRAGLIVGILIAGIVLTVAGFWFLSSSQGAKGVTADTSPRLAENAPPASIAQTPPPSAPAAEESADVMLLLDASGSMLAEDFELDGSAASRFEVLKRATVEFIKSHPKERIGAVAFAGGAYVLSAPTLDHANLLATLEKLWPGKLGVDGSAIGSAIVAGYAQLATNGQRKRVMILVSDGDNNAGFIAPVTAADLAGGQQIRMLVIGLGRKGDALIPVIDAQGNKRHVAVKMTVHENGLKRLADITVGQYHGAPNAQALTEGFHEFETIKEKCPLAAFTATIPERFTSSFGTVSIEGDRLAFKGLQEEQARVTFPKLGPAKAPAATPAASVAAQTSGAFTAQPQNHPPTGTTSTPAADAGPSLTATLSSPTVHVGDTVDFVIKASDLPSFQRPATIAVDGLEVATSSSSQAMNVAHNKVTKTSEYRYSLKPSRTGTFTLPAQSASVGQKTFQTQPLQLVVEEGVAGEAHEGIPWLAEIVPASREAKVGEPLNVEIRFGLDAKTTWQPTAMPFFLPEGFIRGEISAPKTTTASLNGTEYNVVTFQTSLTPLRSGHFILGPVSFPYKEQKASTAAGAKDIFSNVFGNDSFPGAMETHTLRAPGVSVEVVP